MSEPSIKQKPAPPALPARQGKLLLVCEDVENLADYCASLQQQGYETCCSASFAEGVSSVNREAFDLVIVSQGSPAFEGWAVLERAIERDRRTPVLVITRTIGMSSYLEAMQLGASDYVAKPVVASEIVRLARMYIRPASRTEQPRGGG